MLFKEIADTLNFLRKEGYEIYLGLSENFSKEIRGELAVFALNPEKENDELFNTSYLFDRTGNVIAKHRKMHLFDIGILP